MKPYRRMMLASIGMLAFLAVHLQAQRGLKDIPNPDPQFELQSLRVAEGFQINLFASDPMVRKPVQMNWDAQGRLWITTSTTYPQIKPGQKPEDQIVILEDSDGDGRADKSVVFADNLLIPTGLAPGDGGVYVANSTEILHLKDTDGDGKADQRRVVLSGFGTEDVHHMIHTFRWGPDGMLYFNQSIYTHSHVETPWGVRRLRAGESGSFDRSRCSLKSSRADSSIPGATSSTTGDSRSPPTAPTPRGSITCFPAQPL